MGEGSDALRTQDDDAALFGSDAVSRREAESSEDDDRSTAEIRADIEQTRADMSETIEAIQQKLSPQHIKDQVTEQVREATIGKAEDMVRSASDTVSEARSTMMETIRQNPIPAAMVGIGLGWLLMNRRSAPSYSRTRYAGQGRYRGEPYGSVDTYGDYPSETGFYGEERRQQRGIMSQGQHAVSETVSRAQETVGDMAGRAQETVGDIAGRAQETVGDIAGRAQETASHLRHQTQYQAQRVEDRFQQTMYENPLAVGAMALALGAAVGLVAPGSRRENELMGETRDTLVERAQEVAHETVEKVQRVAGQVADEAQSTARQAAQDQGLTR